MIYFLKDGNSLLITELNSLKNLRDDNNLFDKNRPASVLILYQFIRYY